MVFFAKNTHEYHLLNYIIITGPLHNVNFMDFIGFIEFHRIVGVASFIIYILEQSEEIKTLLDYYSNLVQIDVLPWRCPFTDKEIRSGIIHLIHYK